MALNAGSSDQEYSKSRFLNKMAYAFSEDAEDISAGASGDIFVMLDASDSYNPKYGDADNVKQALGLDAGSRVVTTTATELSATVTQHADRVVVIETDSANGITVTLPAATGTGNQYTFVNNLVQTQGTVVIAALGADIMEGTAFMMSSTEEAAQAFRTSATSDKVTLNLTTTGGLGGDRIVAIDIGAATWMVEVNGNGNGGIATPFSATA